MPLHWDCQILATKMTQDVVKASTTKNLSPLVQWAMTQFMAILVNKWKVGKLTLQSLSDPSEGIGGIGTVSGSADLIHDLLHACLSIDSVPAADTVQTNSRIAITYTSALSRRMDPTAASYVNVLVECLATPHGKIFASGFESLLAPEELLSTENHAIIRRLYVQKIFGICVPSLISKFKSCDDAAIKPNYLIALSGILKNSPTEIVMPEIETILPLLLQSIDIPLFSVQSAGIDTLSVTISENADAIEGHIKSVIDRLLARIHNTADKPSDAPSVVRVKALECLNKIPGKLKDSVTLPYKRLVLRELEFAVGDGKRAVRAEAVTCRASWFTLAEVIPDE